MANAEDNAQPGILDQIVDQLKGVLKNQEETKTELHALKVVITGNAEYRSNGVIGDVADLKKKCTDFERDLGKIKSKLWVFGGVFGIVSPFLLWVLGHYMK